MDRRRLPCVLLAAALLLAPPAALAADDDVVPADKEPRHVPKLVNEWVRVVDVEIPEGEQTMFHRHSFDYPYVLMSDVTLYNQVYGQEPKDAKMQAGFIGYYDAATKGAYTHRFINRGPGVFRAIGIELLKPYARETMKLPPLAGAEMVIDNARVGAYRIKLAPGESAGPMTIPGPSIRVSLGEGSISDRNGERIEATRLTTAQFAFREDPFTTTVTNTGDTPVELVEFVLK
ncbi:MAG TPA: hypothetical protein VFV71_03205 [Burkholderiales bacterium]|nr:hypothetical protein [Burkholderiales bacterium]